MIMLGHANIFGSFLY